MNGKEDPLDATLIDLYRQRLRIPATHDLSPTHETLILLVEKHLDEIPFENMALHTTIEARNGHDEKLIGIPLERYLLVDKLLRRNRGGCCLELNGLLSQLLRALGYTVFLAPCWVAAGRERGHASRQVKFRTTQSHFVLLVRPPAATGKEACCQKQQEQQLLVDVGLGEPPINPLQYDIDQLNAIQTTPEGMQSRIRWDPKGVWIDGQARQRKCLIQEWFKEGMWQPRLQWDVAEAPLSVQQLPTRVYELAHFAPVIDILKHDKSSFARKLIVCRLTRTHKISLAGRTLRTTTPRFPTAETLKDQANTVTTVSDLSDQDVVKALLEHFGIELEAEESLDWTASDASSNSQLWDHL